MKHFHTVARANSLVLGKNMFFCKLATFFILATRDINRKLLKFSESSVKIEVISGRTLFLNFLTSAAVICKQRRKGECAIFKTINI